MSHESRRGFLSFPERYWLVAGLLLVALTVFMAWPTTTAQCPMWDVWVVDQSGQPLQGMTVRLTYQNYSVESGSHSEDLQTDASGHVLFRPKSLKVPRIQRAIGTMESAMGGVHASFGAHAWIWAFGNGLDGDAVSDGHITDWTGAPLRMESKIVAKPRRIPIPKS
jgi:hypothetical protein